MGATERGVVKFALYSRSSLAFLQVWLNWVIEDHEPNVFEVPVSDQEYTSTLDNAVDFFTQGFSHWDGQYFLHIAQYGYTYENTLAFLPLFPYIVRCLRAMMLIFVNILSEQQCLLLIGTVFNSCCFISSSVSLYRLTYHVTNSKEMSLVAALFFCINPASIFFSAFYSESLFCALTFWSLLCLEREEYNCALLGFGLSTLTRSNGILSVGFLLFIIARELVQDVVFCLEEESRLWLSQYINVIYLVIKHILIAVVNVLIMLLPFILFQFYAYNLFCTPSTSNDYLPDAVLKYASLKNYTLPGSDTSKWCNYTIPYSYAYVQEHYWNVGFLQYFEFKQVPNFLLAAPLLITVLVFCYDYFKRNQELVQSLGMWPLELNYHPDILQNERCFVYFVHAFVFSLFCIFFVNVQVSTRLLLSASPVPYWIAATYIMASRKSHKEIKSYLREEQWSPIGTVCFLYDLSMTSRRAQLCYYYYLIYFNLGVLMFANNYPWT